MQRGLSFERIGGRDQGESQDPMRHPDLPTIERVVELTDDSFER
jgi:hypothetical protein